MKNITSTLLVSTVLMAPALSWADSQRFVDYARVQTATPVYTTVEHRVPHQQCWRETVRVERPGRGHSSATSTLVGGVIGGAIGHAVGHGKDNKKIGAVVGSVLGMSIGKDIGQQKGRGHGRDNAYYDEVERCEMEYRIEHEERLSGYDVTYRYKGQHYTTFMQEHPGKRVKLAVSLNPMPDR